MALVTSEPEFCHQMKMRMSCEDPNKISFAITTTATAGEWGHFRDCLDDLVMKSLIPNKDIVYAFRNQINDLLGQARKIYWPTEASEQ